MLSWFNSISGRFQVRWQAWFAPPIAPAPGLYTYPIRLEGGRRRLHLRIEADGAGVLFVDVGAVIRLNRTAVEMAKLALDGVSPTQARAHLLRRYAAPPVQLTRELARLYALVEGLSSDGAACPTCAVAEWSELQPPFSLPVAAPYKADLALTYACNNACAHCYNEPGRFTMPTLECTAWFRVLDSLARIGVPHLIFTGGEPTLHPDLSALIHHADANGQVVGMNTNGRRLADPALVAQLAEAGLNHVQITLGSARPAVHAAVVGGNPAAYAETVAGIRNALSGGLHTLTNTTLTRRNRDHALEIVEFLHDLGLRTFAMNGMIASGGGVADPDALPAEELPATLAAVRDRAAALGMRFLWYTVTDYCRFSPLALELEPKRCNAAEYSICIEPNGDVLPCQSYYIAAGNLLRDPWDAIWNSDLFLSFRERETRPDQLRAACRDCPDLPLCGGGCRLDHVAHDATRDATRAAERAAERGCGRGRGRI